MNTIVTPQRLAELTASVLERTAFILAEPAQNSPEFERGAGRCSTIEYSGPGRGRIVIRATDGFARCLAAGLIGVEPDAVTDEHGDDALRELANVIGGSVITELSGERCAYSLGLPQTIADKTQLNPDPGVSPCTCFLDCEGHGLLVALYPGVTATGLAA